ncbi:MAG: hypothetical protein AB7Y46_21145 [Armatimonadota bacterium]
MDRRQTFRELVDDRIALEIMLQCDGRLLGFQGVANADEAGLADLTAKLQSLFDHVEVGSFVNALGLPAVRYRAWIVPQVTALTYHGKITFGPICAELPADFWQDVSDDDDADVPLRELPPQDVFHVDMPLVSRAFVQHLVADAHIEYTTEDGTGEGYPFVVGTRKGSRWAAECADTPRDAWRAAAQALLAEWREERAGHTAPADESSE